MPAAVHSNVGLLHATMAIFNAWCDRMPVLVLGATGPVDAVKRRPWIDWIHTSQDQGALVRNYVKWDAQPASPGGRARGDVARRLDRGTAPMGPVYVNFDAGDAGGTAAPSRCRRSTPPDSCRAVTSGGAEAQVARGRRDCCAARNAR